MLWSEGWLTLNPSFWAVFTGPFGTRDVASSACEELQLPVGSCYPRYVATADTIDPEIGLGMINLSGDGLGLVQVGDPVDETVAALVTVLGSPVTDETVLDGQPEVYGYPTNTYWRSMRWWDDQGLTVTFSDVSAFRSDGGPHFAGWSYAGSTVGPALTTAEGVTVGTSQEP